MKPVFDIHALDGVDLDTEEGEDMLEDYEENLVRRFRESPEGKERLRLSPDTGTWAIDLIEFGFRYLGVSPGTMSAFMDDFDVKQGKPGGDITGSSRVLPGPSRVTKSKSEKKEARKRSNKGSRKAAKMARKTNRRKRK